MNYFEKRILEQTESLKTLEEANRRVNDVGIVIGLPVIHKPTKKVYLAQNFDVAKNKDGTLKVSVAGYCPSGSNWLALDDTILYTEAARVLYLSE